VALKAADKNEHFISGTRAYATMLKYRHCYPDKLLLRNVSDDTLPSHLEMFLTSATGQKPQKILYGENTNLVASFKDQIGNLEKKVVSPFSWVSLPHRII
jgi:hypothetical protein